MTTCPINWSDYFVYDAHTGIVRNRSNRSSNARAGEQVGCLKDNGYLVVHIFGKLHHLHRIAWDISNPEDPVTPDDDIDHLNHIRTDNRAANLRKVKRIDNGRNQSLRATNRSGVMGVCWHTKGRKWSATITVSGRSIYLGLFADWFDAVAARKSAEVRYGFHKNHGKSS